MKTYKEAVKRTDLGERNYFRDNFRRLWFGRIKKNWKIMAGIGGLALLVLAGSATLNKSYGQSVKERQETVQTCQYGGQGREDRVTIKPLVSKELWEILRETNEEIKNPRYFAQLDSLLGLSSVNPHNGILSNTEEYFVVNRMMFGFARANDEMEKDPDFALLKIKFREFGLPIYCDLANKIDVVNKIFSFEENERVTAFNFVRGYLRIYGWFLENMNSGIPEQELLIRLDEQIKKNLALLRL